MIQIENFRNSLVNAMINLLQVQVVVDVAEHELRLEIDQAEEPLRLLANRCLGRLHILSSL